MSDTTTDLWEQVSERPGLLVERMPVPGGWIYRVASWIPQGNASTGSFESCENIVFVKAGAK